MPPLPPPRRRDDEPHRPHNFGAAALVGLCIGLVLVVVSGCLLVDRSTGTTASATPIRASAPTTTTPSPTVRTTPPPTVRTPPRAAPLVSRLGIGMTFGKVTANDGTTLVVRNAFTTGTAKVRTDADTKVHVLAAKQASDIRIGAIVAVYGRRYVDDAILADVITGISVGSPPK
ncbi:hypothetical protein [Nocardia sp. CY15]|uniref:hypothetical protein n=2 Tax=Nocardia TaxID=1817 RepID=UPI001F0C84CF|nr:hypothetical protein [Nocardia sp. CY15]